MNDTVLHTTYASLLAQFVTGVFGVLGLTYDVAPENEAPKTSLKIEMFVQVIEFVFYLFFVGNFDLATMAPTRYKDWIVSTPLMLVSNMIFYYYEQERQEGLDTTNSVSNFFRTHRKTIVTVLLANVAMIALGYAGEVGWMSKGWSVAMGFVAFGVAFSTIWSKLASKSDIGKRLFSVTASVWAMYGVAFLFPVAAKNIAYNGLDVVAKNLFGVFLSYKVMEASSLRRRLGQLSYHLLEHFGPDDDVTLQRPFSSFPRQDVRSNLHLARHSF
jgi:bacteriorhodopsin